MLKGHQRFFRNPAEIAPRHGGVVLVLAPQETAYIPSIFAQQGLNLIFWVTLKANKEAFLMLLDKAVHARVVRFSKDVIAAFREIIFTHLIPSRMWGPQPLRSSLHQRMTHCPCLAKYPDAFAS